jgi:hypothetical protein
MPNGFSAGGAGAAEPGVEARPRRPKGYAVL